MNPLISADHLPGNVAPSNTHINKIKTIFYACIHSHWCDMRQALVSSNQFDTSQSQELLTSGITCGNVALDWLHYLWTM